MKTIKAAALQLEVQTGHVADNIHNAEQLCLQAIEEGARLIALPEFFTTRIVLDQQVYDSVLPKDNEALRMMTGLASQHDCWIGGSMMVADGDEVYNRYYFVEPDGTVHPHDKDIPTMWEAAFYTAGKDDGHFQTQLGGVGAAVCWELIRSQSIQRLSGKVDLLMTGSHWWTTPSNWGWLFNKMSASTAQYNRYLAENAPVEFAQRLGAPLVHANHCGYFETTSSCIPGTTAGLKFRSHFVGHTQIVDANGHILARRHGDAGPGIVTADIEIGAQEVTRKTADNFWLPALPQILKASWYQDGLWGKVHYNRKGRQAGLDAAKRHELI
ncbi:carbon-nitrogen hydrolase family protein [Parendozoicomonas haliclonae]|uniref:C-N hydrolase family amidase n=1 Tax=Parendozoicomonas haliclonae TaxID=1960125 RepID=A0A1X7AMP5_9GAMM|nr:carbon-nitrogen hydrolase family protein [Parendozoicomonas haliclonae]SMA49249.1 C-N hydrolase family amidase [Parendozoicomonas haliclonae]